MNVQTSDLDRIMQGIEELPGDPRFHNLPRVNMKPVERPALSHDLMRGLRTAAIWMAGFYIAACLLVVFVMFLTSNYP